MQALKLQSTNERISMTRFMRLVSPLVRYISVKLDEKSIKIEDTGGRIVEQSVLFRESKIEEGKQSLPQFMLSCIQCIHVIIPSSMRTNG